MKNNPIVPLDFEEQKQITDHLCKTAGISVNDLGSEDNVGYISPCVLRGARDGKVRISTVCGTHGNTISKDMVEALLKAEHVVSIFSKMHLTSEGEVKQLEIVSLAVRGFTEEDGEKLGYMAADVGCSLRPDLVRVCNEDKEMKEWIVFESE